MKTQLFPVNREVAIVCLLAILASLGLRPAVQPEGQEELIDLRASGGEPEGPGPLCTSLTPEGYVEFEFVFDLSLHIERPNPVAYDLYDHVVQSSVIGPCMLLVVPVD